jgi:putative ABC transport system ATP-binding protein
MELECGADMQLIDLRHLVKNYRTGGGEVNVLKNINLGIGQGEFVAVMGPSGSGKSTLINMITGIDHPTEGEIFVDGRAIHALGEDQLARWRGRSIGVIFQFFQLIPTLTILENVVLPMDFCGKYAGRERTQRAMHLLERVGIPEQAESEVASAEQELLAARQSLKEVKRNGSTLAAQAALDEQTARENKQVAESNGWDTSNYEITKAKYALLAAKWQAARKKLEQYPNGVPEEELGLAQARVESAEKRLAAAEAGVKNLELRSPLDGTVVFLDLTAGQVAAPGAVVVAVADLSAWQVRTTDLSETDIPRVKVGDKAVVTLDALPGLQLTGKVASMSAYGQNRQGETVYTVTVQLDKSDDRLRWNMTAMVKIQPE